VKPRAEASLKLIEAIDHILFKQAVNMTPGTIANAHAVHNILQRQFAEHITEEFLESFESDEQETDGDLGLLGR
jgi:hypothetical protein